jgi:glycosyltransferase involved in cell wall biosynthesis
MKIAFVHDYLKEIGGAERVLMALKEIFPEAPVYTAYKFPEYWGQFKPILERWVIHESWGKFLPFLPQFISYYTIFSPLFFSTMDLSKYDVVIISQTGAYFPNGIKVGPKTKVVTYCHTPPRFLYGYPTATTARNRWYWKPISSIANHILLMVDYKFAQKPNLFIANSKNVAERIQKFYRRKSEVVYPPTDLPTVKTRNKSKRDYLLIISRIVGSKNIELAVETAKKYKLKLKVAGRPIGQGGEDIVKLIKGKDIEYLGEVTDSEKETLFINAKAFLALEADADFGVSAVEPQMYGIPVVAFRGGGYLESVVENKTGVFVNELTVDSLYQAILKLDSLKFDTNEIEKNGQKFSKENFQKKMLAIVNRYA